MRTFIFAGAVLASAISLAIAQESGMPTQSGSQEPEMPGTSNPATGNAAQPVRTPPQTFHVEQNGVKLDIHCADSQPVKECVDIAARMLQTLQNR